MSTVSRTTDPTTFWQRQVAPQITEGQIGFDIVFGILLPLVCIWRDPFVFQPDGRALLGRYTIFAGIAGALGMVSLAAWHVIRRPPALFAGLMFGTAIFVTTLGVVLLPFCIVGVWFDRIALLGMSPLATAFVFWRNAIRAYRQAGGRRSDAHLWVFTAIGLLIAYGGPCAVDVWFAHRFSRAAEMALSADPTEAARGITVLKQFRRLPNFAQLVNSDRLATTYEAEKDIKCRQRIAAVYKELTGDDIENRHSGSRD